MVSQHHYEGPDLQALLHQVGNDLGEDAHIVSAQKVRTGGIGGFFVRERFEVVAQPGESRLSDATHDVGSRVGTGAAEIDEFAPDPEAARDILELADRMNASESWVPNVSTQSDTFAEVLARVNEVVGRTEERVEVQAVVTPAPERAPAPIQFPVPEREHGPDLPPAARTRRASRPRAHVHALATLGLPSTYHPAATVRNLRAELVVRLQHLPAPLPVPTDPGSVIAIVGPRPSAESTAERIAAELDVARDDIVVAGAAGSDRPAWCQVHDAAAAASRRRAWWRRATPTIVVVDTETTTDDWANSMLQALEPNLAIGIVDARAKVEDLAYWCEELAIDLIEVEHAARTTSPASVLDVGVPVIRVDGMDASAEFWADLLLERSVR
ncbi:MAG: hypothetical protein ACOYNI_00740 [Acidimicrobiia bacterium]